jgi:hypothetical protein
MSDSHPTHSRTLTPTLNLTPTLTPTLNLTPTLTPTPLPTAGRHAEFAEGEGFEPSVPLSKYDGLANRWFQPLTHLSFPFPDFYDTDALLSINLDPGFRFLGSQKYKKN